MKKIILVMKILSNMIHSSDQIFRKIFTMKQPISSFVNKKQQCINKEFFRFLILLSHGIKTLRKVLLPFEVSSKVYCTLHAHSTWKRGHGCCCTCRPTASSRRRPRRRACRPRHRKSHRGSSRQKGESSVCISVP